MNMYEIGVVYQFMADDDEHAMEQLVDATSQQVADYANYQRISSDNVRGLPSLRLAIRDAKKVTDSMPNGVTVDVPIEALRWLVYGADRFILEGWSA